MLVLRNEQLKAFEENGKQDFVNRAKLFLLEQYPIQAKEYSQSQLEELIKNASDRSLNYGIKTEQGIMCFIVLMFEWALDFDTNLNYKWVQPVLNSKEKDEEDKIEVLFGKL